MSPMRKMLIVALPLALLAGCETMGQSDRAMIESSNKSAADAKTQAAAAMAAANKAAAAAEKAAAAADNAAREAKMAGDKADRVFRRGLRK